MRARLRSSLRTLRRALVIPVAWWGLCAAAPVHAQTPGVIMPEARAWQIVGSMDQGEATNLSGLACAGSAEPRPCLLVSDDTRYARLATVEAGTIRLGGEVPLLPEQEGGEQFKDTDAEGVDVEGGFYYVAGSHGASRRKGEYERSRFLLYRFPVGAGPVERSSRLEAVLARLPALADHACTGARPCRSLQDGGVNIEGLAARDGCLYLGLRGPSLDGAAFIVRLGIDAVFGEAEPRPDIFRLRLGDGVGIRDLAKVRDGFLILTGPAAPGGEDAAATAEVFHWAGDGGNVVRLGALGGVAHGAKPEALLVLDETENGYRVLVLSDGPPSGDPAEFRLPRRP